MWAAVKRYLNRPRTWAGLQVGACLGGAGGLAFDGNYIGAFWALLAGVMAVELYVVRASVQAQRELISTCHDLIASDPCMNPFVVHRQTRSSSGAPFALLFHLFRGGSS